MSSPSELTEAAEQLARLQVPSMNHMTDRAEREPGVLQMLVDLQQLAQRDGCVGAAYALDVLTYLSDPTPLTDLTAEQWEAMGFVRVQNYYQHKMHPIETLHLGDSVHIAYLTKMVPAIKTVGQLRLFVAAIAPTMASKEAT